MRLDIKNILEQWLKENGYDGLYRESCGCQVGDLMPCDEPGADCKAGYKVPCPGPEVCCAGGDCDWHISGSKGVTT